MVLITVVAAVGLLLLAHPYASADSDLFQNIGPASQVPDGALMDAYPLGRYALDHHFDAVKAGVLSGVDVSGIPPTIAWMLANVLWTITAFLAQTVITVFTFAFSLDLVNGSSATGGQGALQPVSRAVQSIYQTTFGEPWLIVAILLAGLWAMYQVLVRRRYAETAGSLALSIVLVVIALAFVSQPQATIGAGSRLSNQMSGAFLSLTSKGSVSNADQAKQSASDQLFALLVYEPWAVLQFGGLEHCVKTPVDRDDPTSVAVRPLSADPDRDAVLSSQLRRTGQVQADGKTCVNNERKYAPHFLRFGIGSDQRDQEHDALTAGDTGKLPDADPAKKAGDYRLSAVDKPAADAMGKGGQYQRLLLALVIFVAELGAFCLLGALSVSVILAQVLVLLLLAFAPVALVIAVFPGRGHEFFLGWLSRLVAFLLRKAIYSLVLAVLLAVAAALADATSSLGWLMAFGLQAVFFWAVLLYRRQLIGHLTLATTGPAGRGDEGAAKLLGLYAAARATKRLIPRRHTPPAPPKPQEITVLLPDGDQPSPPSPPAPEDPASPSDGHESEAPDGDNGTTPVGGPVANHDPARAIEGDYRSDDPPRDTTPEHPVPSPDRSATATPGRPADASANVPKPAGPAPDALRAFPVPPSSGDAHHAVDPPAARQGTSGTPTVAPGVRQTNDQAHDHLAVDHPKGSVDRAGQQGTASADGRSSGPTSSPLQRDLDADARTQIARPQPRPKAASNRSPADEPAAAPPRRPADTPPSTPRPDGRSEEGS